MNSSSLAPVAGLLAGLPAVLAGTLGGAPWWALGAIVIAAYLAIALTSLILDHNRQRKGNIVDEKFAAALDEITDPEKRIQAIINYRQATASVPQPPPDPPPGGLPLAEAWDSGASTSTSRRREAYANDHGAEQSLVAVTARSNRSKSDQDPAE